MTRLGKRRSLVGRFSKLLDDARVKTMDTIVSKLAKRDVHTSPRDGEGPMTEKDPEVRDDHAKHEPRPDPREAPQSVEEPPVSHFSEGGPHPELKEPVEESKPEPDYGIFADLPPRYGSHRLALIARDPAWAFAYWDVDHQRGPALFEEGAQAVLRLVDANDGRVLQSPKVHPESGRYYFKLPAADQRYQAVLVAVREGGETEVLRSNAVLAPPQLPRPSREPRFVSTAAQRAVLAEAGRIDAPPRLDCQEARRAAMYDTPSIAGRTLTLKPSFEKPHAAPVEEPAKTGPGQSAKPLGDVRALLSGSESAYAPPSSEEHYRSISSPELLKR